jgi:hypothetical protein
VNTIRWLALLLVGCGSGATTHPPTTPNTTTDTTNEAAVADLADCQPHAYGGVTQFVAMSLDAVALTPEQRGRFVPITADLYTKMEVVRGAEAAVFTVLADGIARATIDTGTVDSGIGRLKIDATTVYNLATDSLNRLHAMLSAEQRVTLMNDIEARWTSWQAANPTNDANRPEGDLAAVATALGLGANQLVTMRHRFGELIRASSPPDIAAVTRNLHNFEKAFEGDNFDALVVPQSSIGSDLAGWSVTRIARLCEAIHETLTPEQRAKLVALLRCHAASESKGTGVARQTFANWPSFT